MTYEQLIAGEPVAIADGSTHRVSCCGCGLVHVISLEIRTTAKDAQAIVIKATLDKRSTAQRRRTREIREKIAALAAPSGAKP